MWNFLICKPVLWLLNWCLWSPGGHWWSGFCSFNSDSELSRWFSWLIWCNYGYLVCVSPMMEIWGYLPWWFSWGLPPPISSSGAHFPSQRSGYWPWATSDCQPLTQMLLLTAIAFQKDESCISTIFSIMTYFERAHQKRARVWKKYGLWFLHECAHQIMVPQAPSSLLLNVPGWNPSIVVILWAPSDLGGSRTGREIRIFIFKNKETLPGICGNLLWMTPKKGPPVLGFSGS